MQEPILNDFVRSSLDVTSPKQVIADVISVRLGFDSSAKRAVVCYTHIGISGNMLEMVSSYPAEEKRLVRPLANILDLFSGI